METIKNNYGAYINIKKKLEMIIPLMLKQKRLSLKSNKITLKFCGDGTQIYKNCNVYNYAMSIIEDGKCKSSKGHFIIGIFEVKETYENLKECLKEIMLQIDDLKTIEINKDDLLPKIFTKNFLVELDVRFANDLKATSQIMEINMAGSKYPCPWCKLEFIGKKGNNEKTYKIGIKRGI